jgi:hypothetical protein
MRGNPLNLPKVPRIVRPRKTARLLRLQLDSQSTRARPIRIQVANFSFHHSSTSIGSTITPVSLSLSLSLSHCAEQLTYVGAVTKIDSTFQYDPLVVSVLPEAKRYRVMIWTPQLVLQIFLENVKRHERSRSFDDGKTDLSDDEDNANAKEKAKEMLGNAKNALKSKFLKFESKPHLSSALLKEHVAIALAPHRGIDIQIELDHVSKDDVLREALLKFELEDPLRPRCFSIGVVFAKENQNEDEFFANRDASSEFEEFLNFLGDRIGLPGWTGYRGDLDVVGTSTGTHSLYRRWKGIEIMFHVTTMLLFEQNAEQVLNRKRRIGNDIATIIYQQGGAFAPPIRSQFLHCYYVASPVPAEKLSFK